MRYYDLHGQLHRIVGRKGAGPGEFEDLAWIQGANGDVAAYDQDLHRVSFFGPQGDFLRSVRVVAPEDYVLAVANGVLADGSILAHAWPSGWQPETPVTRDTLAILLYDSLGSFHDGLGSFLWDERYQEHRSGEGFFRSRLPFGRRSAVAVAGSRYYVMESEGYGIDVFDSTGTAVRELHSTVSPPPIEIAEADLRVVRARMARPEVPPVFRLAERFDRMPLPDVFPPYGWLGRRDVSILRVSHDGEVWALEFGGVRDSSPIWLVFAADGTVRGRVAGSEELDLLDVRGDTVLVRRWDAYDVETVETRRVMWR